MSSINFLLSSPEEPTANRSETPSLTEFTLPEPAIPLPENPSDFTHVGQGYTVTTTAANPMAISRILNDSANNGSNEPVTIISPMPETIHNATTTSEKPQYDRPNKRKLAATDDELNDEGPPSKKTRSYANSEFDYDSDTSSYCSTCWDVDSDIDSDTDSDIDTNTDFDSDTDAGSNTDLDLNADSDTDYDSDTDSDSDSDSDSDVDIDPPPMEVFLDNGIPMVIDNVTFLPRRRMPQDDFTGEQARHWYRERVRRDRERHEE